MSATMRVLVPGTLDASDDRPRSATPGEVARVRRAMEMVLRSLSVLPDRPEVLRLVEQARAWIAETDRWQDSPPLPERCEDVMRATLLIHLDAVRAVSHGQPR